MSEPLRDLMERRTAARAGFRTAIERGETVEVGTDDTDDRIVLAKLEYDGLARCVARTGDIASGYRWHYRAPRS